MKGGNPKCILWDDVVTYWNFDEFIEIYIQNTIQLSSFGLFQFKCDNINFTLNLPMSETSSENPPFGFPPFIYNTVAAMIDPYRSMISAPLPLHTLRRCRMLISAVSSAHFF